MLDPGFKFDRRACAELLADSNTSATTCHAILLSAYPDLYDDGDGDPIDPPELWARVREDFSTTVHEHNENKINALMLVMSSDGFFEDPWVFVSVTLGLQGDLGDLVDGVFEEPKVAEILWAGYEVELNRGNSETTPEFSPAVSRYVDGILNTESEDPGVTQADQLQNTLPWYERFIIVGKTDIVRELMRIGADEAVVRQVMVSDTTPIIDAEGNLVDVAGLSPRRSEESQPAHA